MRKLVSALLYLSVASSVLPALARRLNDIPVNQMDNINRCLASTFYWSNLAERVRPETPDLSWLAKDLSRSNRLERSLSRAGVNRKRAQSVSPSEVLLKLMAESAGAGSMADWQPELDSIKLSDRFQPMRG